MEALCGVPFWNSSVSWDSNNPTFSLCFQNLILVLAPCAVLWIVAPFEFVKIFRSRINPSPWSKRMVFKLALKFVLLLICTLDVSKDLFSFVNHPERGCDALISSVAYFVTIALTIILSLLCRRRGIRASLALPSFWMISTVSTLISIYNDIQLFDSEDWTKVIGLIDDTLTFTISLIQLFLSVLTEPSLKRESSCPLEDSSLVSRLTFSWILNLMKKGVDNSLHQEHLIPLCPEVRSASVARHFSEECQRQRSSTPQFPENESSFAYFPRGKSLALILLKISQKSLIIAFCLEITYSAVYFLPIYVISLILDEEKNSKEWHLYFYSTVLFLALLFSSFFNSQRKYFGLSGALTIKTAVINAVFSKAFNTWPVSKKIKNFLMVDADNIFQATCILNEAWGSLMRLVIGIYILYCVVGQSCFVGVLAIFLLVPLNIIVEYCISNIQKNRKQEMIDLLSECLNGMKALKLYAWEEIFLKKLFKIRKSERSKLRKASFLRMAFKFLYLSSTSVMSLATISAYVLIEDSIDAKTLLLSFFIVCMLKTPFQNFFHDLNYFIEGLISVKKVQSFLETKELERIPMLSPVEGSSILLKNVSFAWNDNTPNCLRNVNLRVPKGSLIAVVGERESGKSSLLRALLGEIQRVEGEAVIEGNVEFVTKTSWIQNTTLEKNVLFLKIKDTDFYRKTVEACALAVDVESLPAAEETEIGQKGVQLSPVQKIKVDLARAVYQNADLYIFDEPFEHLDMALKEQLYHRVIGRNGILKRKTRIFMTKSDDFLPLMDSIMFLKSGRIVECGTYEELTEKDGHFSEYLRNSRIPSTSTYSNLSDFPPKIEEDCVEKSVSSWWSALSPPSKVMQASTDEPSNSSKALASKLADCFKLTGFCLSTAIILIAALASFCEVTSGVYLFKWADELEHLSSVKYNLFIFAGVILAQILLTITCGVALFLTSDLTAGKLFTWLLHQFMRASQLVYEITPVKKIVKSFEVDFHYMDERIAETIYVWLLILLKIPSFLVVIFMVFPTLAVLVIPLVYGFLVIQKLYLRSRQQLEYLTTSTSRPLSNLVEDTLQGISHIRASNATFHYLERFHKKLDTHNNCFFLLQVVSRWLSALLEITVSVLVFIIAVSAFGKQNDCLTILAILCSIQLGDTLIAFAYTTSMLDVSMFHFERIMSYFQLKQELEREDPANKPPESWPDVGSISIQNLTAVYGGNGMYPLIQNIKLSIQPGEKVAVIGEEESGVDTFFYTLFRLIEPLDGNIIIDNVDTQIIGLRDLRSKLAVIPQETIVFKGTLRYNLDPGQVYTDGELKSALGKADFNRFLSLDSIVDNHISFEEKRLLSIVRCLLKKPKLVIIDEEEPLSPKCRELFKESTVLSFSKEPLKEFNGRIVRFLSGEIVNQVLPKTNNNI